MAGNGNFVELILTCKDRTEADKIADTLLKKKLVGCVKFMPVDSRYWHKGKIEEGQEVMLLMESVASNFEKVEAEITKLHSYNTFVLKQIPIQKVSAKAEAWLKEVLG